MTPHLKCGIFARLRSAPPSPGGARRRRPPPAKKGVQARARALPPKLGGVTRRCPLVRSRRGDCWVGKELGQLGGDLHRFMMKAPENWNHAATRSHEVAGHGPHFRSAAARAEDRGFKHHRPQICRAVSSLPKVAPFECGVPPLPTAAAPPRPRDAAVLPPLLNTPPEEEQPSRLNMVC